MKDTIRIELDLTEVEQVDNGREVVYGGWYMIDGVKHRAKGDDRTTGNYLDEIMEAIELVSRHVLGEAPDPEEVLDLLMGLDSGAVLMWKAEDGVKVRLEE